jgi:hypothetical protein
LSHNLSLADKTEGSVIEPVRFWFFLNISMWKRDRSQSQLNLIPSLIVDINVNNLNVHVDIIPMDGYPLDAKQLDKDGLDYFLTVQFQQIYK